MSISRVFILVLVADMLFATTALAQEKEIKRSDLPATVEKTVTAQSQRATIRGFSEERRTARLITRPSYWSMVTAKIKSEVQVGPDGKPLDHEE